MTFRTDILAQAQHEGTYSVPDELLEAYFLSKGWDYDKYRSTPRHLIEGVLLIWELENKKIEYQNRQMKAASKP